MKNKKSHIKEIDGNSNPKVMADIMNSHLASVGEKLAANFGQSELLEEREDSATDFNLNVIDAESMWKLINCLQSSKACEMEGVTVRLLTDAGPRISDPITHIINLSIESSCFASCWKVSLVTPIFKDGNWGEPNNYRLITLLSLISKLAERMVHDQLYEHLRQEVFFSDAQSGFRKGHFTTTCLIDFLDGIYDDIENGMVSGVLFLDLKKAFDLVNHKILLNKMRSAGLSTKCVKWFDSYLKNRCQATKVNNEMSSVGRVRYGIPQGSILGLLLFVIYINDLPQSLHDSRVHLYADDMVISVTGTSTEDLDVKLSARLQKVASWMRSNQFTLNVKKTNIMTFGTTHTINRIGELEIVDGTERVEVVENAKYLGVMLDRKLSFSDHVQYIKKKCICRIKMLTKLRPIVGENVSLSLYKSLMVPLLDYTDVVYDTLSARDNAILQRMQNCALKVVIQTEWRTPTKEIHQRLHMNLVANR